MPAPLRPSSATTSCSRTSSDTSLQDMALAVERVDAIEREQRLGAGRADARLAMPRAPHPSRCKPPARAWRIARVLHRAVQQHLAFVHDRHVVGEAEHAVDVVLDQQHRNVGGELLDQRPDALALGRGEARERLVEQQQARLGGQRQPHVDQPLAAVGQGACLRALDAVEPEIARSSAAVSASISADGARAGPQIEAARMARLHGEADVLRDRQGRKQVGDLERAADAGAADAVRRQAGDVVRAAAGSCPRRAGTCRRPG